MNDPAQRAENCLSGFSADDLSFLQHEIASARLGEEYGGPRSSAAKPLRVLRANKLAKVACLKKDARRIRVVLN
jgi:hypothetical protein